LYEAAFELYNQLLDTAEAVSVTECDMIFRWKLIKWPLRKNSEEHSDILTNLQASQKHLDFINSGFLHALDALPASVTSVLETAPPPVQQSTTAAIASASTSANAPAEDTKTKPKKIRMSRVPAGVIPGVTPPPDPERWLKKSERSNFGQGRRRKGAVGGGATQGSATVESAPTQAGANKSGAGKNKKKK